MTDLIERLRAERDQQYRQVEGVVLAEYSRDDGLREWWSGGAWLYPGDRIVQVHSASARKPLTDEQAQALYDRLSSVDPHSRAGWLEIVRAVERAHGIH